MILLFSRKSLQFTTIRRKERYKRFPRINYNQSQRISLCLCKSKTAKSTSRRLLERLSKGLTVIYEKNNYAFSVLNDRISYEVQDKFKKKQKQLKSHGHGVRPNAADPLSDKDMTLPEIMDILLLRNTVSVYLL